MNKETKNCPYCGEEILAVAKKCKHCGEWLNLQPIKEFISCSACGEQVEKGTIICPHCQEPLASSITTIEGKWRGVTRDEIMTITFENMSNNIGTFILYYHLKNNNGDVKYWAVGVCFIDNDNIYFEHEDTDIHAKKYIGKDLKVILNRRTRRTLTKNLISQLSTLKIKHSYIQNGNMRLIKVFKT